MRRPVVAAAMVVAVALLTGACGAGSRERARGDLVDQLIEGGLTREVAECVVDGFFDGRSDAELKAFFAREDLTADERAEFARLGEVCTEATPAPGTTAV